MARCVARWVWRACLLLTIAPCISAVAFAQANSSGSASLRLRIAESLNRGLHLDRPTAYLATRLEVLSPDLQISGRAQVHLIATRPATRPEEWLLRLDCLDHRDCLPFYALLREVGETPCCQSSLTPQPAKQAAQPIVVRAGEVVQITEQRSGLHLATPGICLDGGGLGESVRVRTRFSRVVLRAVVAGQNWVTVGNAP